MAEVAACTGAACCTLSLLRVNFIRPGSMRRLIIEMIWKLPIRYHLQRGQFANRPSANRSTCLLSCLNAFANRAKQVIHKSSAFSRSYLDHSPAIGAEETRDINVVRRLKLPSSLGTGCSSLCHCDHIHCVLLQSLNRIYHLRRISRPLPRQAATS